MKTYSTKYHSLLPRFRKLHKLRKMTYLINGSLHSKHWHNESQCRNCSVVQEAFPIDGREWMCGCGCACACARDVTHSSCARRAACYDGLANTAPLNSDAGCELLLTANRNSVDCALLSNFIHHVVLLITMVRLPCVPLRIILSLVQVDGAHDPELQHEDEEEHYAAE